MIEVMFDSGIDAGDAPNEAMVRHAVAAACMQAGISRQVTLCVRFADDAAIQQLNSQWRNKDAPTDVLSFPMQEGPDYELDESLGDIILSWPFVLREAARLSLSPQQHAQHLIVHGMFHLMGFVHGEDIDAERMQAMESRAMRQLGLHNPYAQSGEDHV
ncbi:MAG: rRNA maturation RNase YbeY [Mariprofundaceae bacterium]|nr:rRNA maturation RNase YbeY [Mariprofundaceae bacterium]